MGSVALLPTSKVSPLAARRLEERMLCAPGKLGASNARALAREREREEAPFKKRERAPCPRRPLFKKNIMRDLSLRHSARMRAKLSLNGDASRDATPHTARRRERVAFSLQVSWPRSALLSFCPLACHRPLSGAHAPLWVQNARRARDSYGWSPVVCSLCLCCGARKGKGERRAMPVCSAPHNSCLLRAERGNLNWT
jgi:hypothetical protein